jgi:hypothetical protein
MKRLLLLQEHTPQGDKRVRKLCDAGYELVIADSQDLYWPKFVETGEWHAVVFDQSSFMNIYVEMASEYGCSRAPEIPIILVTASPPPDEELPSSFKTAKIAVSDEHLLEILAEL